MSKKRKPEKEEIPAKESHPGMVGEWNTGKPLHLLNYPKMGQLDKFFRDPASKLRILPCPQIFMVAESQRQSALDLLDKSIQAIEQILDPSDWHEVIPNVQALTLTREPIAEQDARVKNEINLMTIVLEQDVNRPDLANLVRAYTDSARTFFQDCWLKYFLCPGLHATFLDSRHRFEFLREHIRALEERCCDAGHPLPYLYFWHDTLLLYFSAALLMTLGHERAGELLLSGETPMAQRDPVAYFASGLRNRLRLDLANAVVGLLLKPGKPVVYFSSDYRRVWAPESPPPADPLVEHGQNCGAMRMFEDLVENWKCRQNKEKAAPVLRYPNNTKDKQESLLRQFRQSRLKPLAEIGVIIEGPTEDSRTTAMLSDRYNYEIHCQN